MINQIHQIPQCYSSGCDLWVLPLNPDSSWFKRINWYSSSQLSFWMYKKILNFQFHWIKSLKKNNFLFVPLKPTTLKIFWSIQIMSFPIKRY